ncbi:S-adenosyl-L-methionine-dependent methyltransferase [Clathrospora elynae]|uniref:S-adenosyl-L-methionine-dependent methyltransferase n=1 Tax=Clathrospora elynae TaxID=706981 RepID=A0A6A5SE09_9PLEO|nr:S-adenosyl-L-methionine-dependent methyltransferase [Clathrospora elynae]
MWSGAAHVVDAMEKWPSSQEPTQTAYGLAHGTDLTFFEHLAGNETKAKHFSDSMTFMQSAPELRHDFVHEYDWSRHARGTVVDVGGSKGAIALKLAENYPNMKIIVQDRAEIITHGPRYANTNIEFQAHDLFTPQPVKGADVYFLRWILHDWPAR